MGKLWGLLVTILAAAASIFGYKYQKSERERSEDRAETAEKGLENAKSSLKIDTRVKSLDDATRERLRDDFTQR
jgi:hypothetical protein